ncbi:hypothetical protein ERJ75_001375500 [Trypanosoma vivax]|nr:hypothetical protein ERJ75_001375500 [Trypanosoma vivax]
MSKCAIRTTAEEARRNHVCNAPGKVDGYTRDDWAGQAKRECVISLATDVEERKTDGCVACFDELCVSTGVGERLLRTRRRGFSGMEAPVNGSTWSADRKDTA